MKKFLIAVGSVLAVLLFGIFLFVITFNVNRYKPLLVEVIEKALDAKAEVGNLSLSLSGGVSVDVNGLKIYSKEDSQKPAIQVKKASASVELAPLLKKKLNILSVMLLEPSVILNHEADGSMNIGGISIPGESKNTKSIQNTTNNSSAQTFSISIRTVQIKNAFVEFNERSGAEPIQVNIENIDISLKNFSIQDFFSFSAAASLFSSEQNFKIEGEARLPAGPKVGFLKNVYFKTDLKDLDLKSVAQTFPDSAKSLPPENLQGLLEIRIAGLPLDPAGLPTTKINLDFKNGRVVLPNIQKAVESINAKTSFEEGNLNLEDLSASFAGGQMRLSGRIEKALDEPILRVHAVLQELDINELMKAVSEKTPRLNGHVSVEFEGAAQGLSWPEISKTLTGKGRIVMKDGVLLNFNLLREIVQRISVIPGAETILQNNFPEAYRKSLQENSTILHPIDLSTTVQNGVFIFNPLFLQTDLIRIVGAGQVGLDQTVVADANLTMQTNLSLALVRVLSPLQILLNEQNEIFMPAHIEGKLPQVRAIPDKEYLISKLLGGGTQQILQNLIQKPKEGSKEGVDKISNLFNTLTGAKEAKTQ